MRLANDTACDRTTGHADSNIERHSLKASPYLGCVQHAKGDIERGLGMIGPWLGCAADRHVRIAYRLDLFEPSRRHELIESTEQVIEDHRDASRFCSLCPRREVDDVREKHRCLRVNVCDVFFAVAQTACDRGRNSVGQQLV
jgi:hypothetical protein